MLSISRILSNPASIGWAGTRGDSGGADVLGIETNEDVAAV
jgi:hypothetical protein